MNPTARYASNDQGTLLAHLEKKKTTCTKCGVEKDAEFEVKNSSDSLPGV